jgi:homoserine kinase type II
MVNLEEIVQRYGLIPPVRITPLADTGRNNHLWKVETAEASYVLKQHTSTSYDDPASFIYEWTLLNRLLSSSLSFAIPMPYVGQRGALICMEEGCFSLAAYLPGARMTPSDLNQVRAFGEALGELQTALAHVPITSRPGRPLFERLFDFPAIDVCALTAADLGLTPDPALDDLLAWWRAEASTLKTFAETRYRSLPWQICHNDVTPNNVLIEDQRVSAVLDFEFMSPAARALDVAMALRTTMRIWETPEPWPVVEQFLAGYSRSIRLTEDEIMALPLLLRLRAALPIVWWVGRQQGLDRVPSLIENLRTLVNWLNRYEEPFLDCVRRSITR